MRNLELECKLRIEFFAKIEDIQILLKISAMTFIWTEK